MEVKNYNEELYKKFFDLVGEGKQLSQSDVAKQLKYSAGTISQYKARTYPGNIAELERKIAEWFKGRERRLSRLEVPIVGTYVTDKFALAANIARDECCIAVLTGCAGIGKTTAAERYAAESYNVLLIHVDPSFTMNVLVAEIARVVGVESKGGVNVTVGRIIEALRERDAVLIIDEADYLSDGSLELVRRVINDKARTGVVLIGLPRLEYKLRNLRNDHEQLTSRVGVLLKFEKMKKADALKILHSVWADLSAETVAEFLKIADGSVRTLVKLMTRVHQTMNLNKLEVPDADVVAEAGELLMR